MPIQQMLLGSAPASETYVDDVFSNYVWNGTGSSRAIDNGINFSSKGGMVWTKARTDSWEPALEDTLRGVGKEVWSNSNAVETYHAERINSFNSSGYSMGTSQRYNRTGKDYVSWTFAKQEGFFDVVTWTGDNDANRQIPHGLGSIPGCIMVKCRNQDQMWSV